MKNVKNLISPASGAKVANQFEVTEGNVITFVSYTTKIAELHDKKIILDNNALDYSRTTSKWLYHFLRTHIGGDVNRATVLKGIKSGYIKTANLNA